MHALYFSGEGNSEPFTILTPKDFVVPIRVERRIYIDQIDTAIRQLAQLVEIIAAVNDTRVDDGGGLRGHYDTLPVKAQKKGRIARVKQRLEFRNRLDTKLM